MENKLILRKSMESGLRWVYVFLGVIIMMCFGTVYSWGIFRMPVEKAFNIGSTQSGFPYMASLAFYALFMMLSGRYFNKFSPRVIILTGSLLLSFGWMLSSFSLNIYTLPITYGVIGGAGVGIAYGVPLAIVTKWFPEKKGFVIGLVLLGFAVSPLVTAPLAIVPTATGMLYGAKHYSQNYGVVFTAYGIGAILGVSGSGLILDIFKNYYFIFYLVIGLCFAGCLVTVKLIKD